MESPRIHVAPVRGFSLVEMLVVLSIIAIVTTIALLGQTTFNRSLYLTDTAYSVALSIREMQTLGLSSRVFGTGVSTVQNAGYGAALSTANLGQYTLFADTARTIAPPTNCDVGTSGQPDAKPGDCIYTANSDGIVETYKFGRGFTIQKFCGKSGSTSYCSVGTPSTITDLSIVFLRNSTETMAEGKVGGTVWTPMTSAEIYIQSPDGLGVRAICISQVGQISVALAACP